MLLDLRETVRNSKPIKYTLITLICIPFVLFGIGSYFSGGNVAAVAEVEGQPISQEQLDRAYQQQRQQLARMFGGELPEALDNEQALRQQALDQLVDQQVLALTLEEQRFAVSNETLGRAIRELPAFQVDGRFDREMYQNQLRASGMSVAAFEQSFRDDTALRQFQRGVIDTGFTLRTEAERMAELANQARSITAVEYSLEDAMQAIDPDDAALEAWFADNADRFQFPERVKLRYVELDGSALAESIDVSDEEARAYYDDNRSRYMRDEQRRASHILLNVDDFGDTEAVEEKRETLRSVKQRLDAGESFADLAAEVSEDVGSADNGGSLGLIQSGMMVEEFEEALAEIPEVGDVSDVVQTEFGLHLIKLDGIEAESGKPFEEVKDEIVATIQQDTADAEFNELRELLTESAFDNPESLEAAAEVTGLEIQESDWVDADTDPSSPLGNPAVLRTALSEEVLEEGNNSDPIELGPRQLLVLRVVEHEDPRPKTLAEVRDEALEALTRELATEQLDELAEAGVKELSDGGEAAAIAEDEPLASVRQEEGLTRQSDALDRNVLNAIFAAPKPDGDAKYSDVSVLPNGNRLAWRLESVDAPSPGTETAEDADASEQESPASAANPQAGSVEFSALLQSLRSKADVDLEP